MKSVESMEEEEESITRSQLLKQKLDSNHQWSSTSDHGGVQLSESSSTTTSIVVLSTLVAVCGSFTFGSAVSTITILFFLLLYEPINYYPFVVKGWVVLLV